jgi:hypothetical protein
MLLYVLSFSETKQTHSLDGSSVLPFDLLKAELFIQTGKRMSQQMRLYRRWQLKWQLAS